MDNLDLGFDNFDFASLVSPDSLEALAPLAPLAGFLLIALVASIIVRGRTRAAGGTFVNRYFIGNRALGGFVLAMTTIATYGSVSSFVGGPGQAWDIGFGWVYMAVVQVTALVLLYGIFGKKMGLISRKLNAVTVVDVIRARYGSNALANLSALVIVLFFAATMVAQFVGGAKLFEAVTGYSYVIGLGLFGVAVVLFTTIGGFRGVAVTDALCGIMMLVGIVVLACGILDAGGGYEAIMHSIATHEPQMLEPFAGGAMPPSLYLTQWLLVGVFTFVLPQSVVRTMGYRDTRALHSAMIWGTVIIGAMMIGVTSLGVLSAGVLTEDLAAYGGSVDNIIPSVIVESLPPVLAGVAIIGPVAASISTVSSLLISSSSAIIKDVCLHACESRGIAVREGKVAFWSQAITLLLGVAVFALSVTPPDVIWKINMFAFGGLETAFFFVLVCGLFWKRANALGALLSLAGGTAAYCATMALGFKVADLHQIVIGIAVAAVLMLLGSLIGKQRPNARMEVFFPREIDAGREVE
ncbi:sodium/pantothenate symporter [Adlercreutzia caecimuris]|uniref:sodium/pantothenate symporter n=1 Tax=Adlercreutzia caecimuris TaxID=671266 RepID=UPI0020CD30B0|nr:sodium/pantothenate symporter [Adlercreutzia caecimuris]MCR2036649.1 sodium/pantothenate symporter [Adlercreutzia caecimuris]